MYANNIIQMDEIASFVEIELKSYDEACNLFNDKGCIGSLIILNWLFFCYYGVPMVRPIRWINLDGCDYGYGSLVHLNISLLHYELSLFVFFHLEQER